MYTVLTHLENLKGRRYRKLPPFIDKNIVESISPGAKELTDKQKAYLALSEEDKNEQRYKSPYARVMLFQEANVRYWSDATGKGRWHVKITFCHDPYTIDFSGETASELEDKFIAEIVRYEQVEIKIERVKPLSETATYASTT